MRPAPTPSGAGRAARAALPAGLLLVLALLLGASLRLPACQDAEAPRAVASRVESRTQLIGGPGALGEVGDFLLQNDKIRVIIQDKGFSRGFGVYGGSLIDADLVRPVRTGALNDNLGRDQFGELFPIFFLEAMVPDNVEVVSDGLDGSAASVRVSGTGGDFLTLAKALNQIILNSHNTQGANILKPETLKGDPQLRFETLYELEPGKNYVKITNTLINITEKDLPIPSPSANTLLQLFLGTTVDLDVPLGTVLLFGAGNNPFAPGAGYDIRFALEDAYKKGQQLQFPALPGLLTDVMATSSTNGVSYGFMSAGDTPGFVANREACDCLLGGPQDCDAADPSQFECSNAYTKAYPGEEVQDSTMLLPFIASGFTGAFYAQTPKMMAPGERFSYTTYFIVGDGDVASVFNVAQELRGVATETLEGIVRDEQTLEPLADASVIVYDANNKPVNQLFTNRAGRFKGQLPAGSYTARVSRDPVLSRPIPFQIEAGKGGFVELAMPRPAFVTVRVRDKAGRDLPAKVTLVGTRTPQVKGLPPREYLFDLQAGQRFRLTDLVPDDPDDPNTLQFIENSGYTEDGVITLPVRVSGDEAVYTVYVSRGIEYDVQAATVRVKSGTTELVSTVLNRVVDTRGYISGDFHLHAAPSLDSDLDLTERVISIAGEGLEYPVSTDHNFVTDYRPFIERAGLTEWMSSMVGLEMTTLESGHFNGFPVKREPEAITRGSFEWSLKPPQEVFDRLREQGKYGPESTIIQVNHARDSILGYFSQYGIDGLTGELIPPPPGIDPAGALAVNGPAFLDPETGESTFSDDFDAMEVFNGKRFEQIHHYRAPRNIPELGVEAGQILCDGGEVAFPGMVDDWFNLLNKGRTIAATGNSDSHETEGEEPGYPRTYFWAGQDDPAFVDDVTVIEAFKNNRLIITNGPFIELFVNDAPVGAKIADSDGSVKVRIKIQAAEWVGVNKARLFANGEEVMAWDVELKEGVFEDEVTLEVERDTWFVLEASGDRSMFPVIPPLELPPILLTDAVGALAGAFGFASELDDYAPSLTHQVTAFAITNPIWVDQDGGGFDPPGVLPLECKADAYGATPKAQQGKGVVEVEEALKPLDPALARRIQLKRTSVPSIGFPRLKGDIHDVRTIFEQFGKHGHSH